MHRTLNGLIIIAVIGVSVLRSLLGLSAEASTGPVPVTLLLLALGSIGLLAIRAMVEERASARMLVSTWAGCVLGYVVLADVLAGFARPGVGARLLVTGLIAALLAAVVVSVPRAGTRSGSQKEVLA